MSAPDPVALARTLRAAERTPRKTIAELQQARLHALVTHARERSPYYRRVLPSTASPAELATLPTLDKATLHERFDEIVCDPRLRRDALEAHLAGSDRHLPYRGEFQVMRTSGSSGRPGLFVYDQAGWAAYVAQFLRVTALTGTAMWEHPGLKVGVVSATDPTHASAQIAMILRRPRARARAPAAGDPAARPDRRRAQRGAARRAARLRVLRSPARRRAAGGPPPDRAAACHLQQRAAQRPTARAASRPHSGSPRSTSTPPPRDSGAPSARSTPAFTCSKSGASSRTSTPTDAPSPTERPAPDCSSPTSSTWPNR